jgi:hypothetical protein
LTEWEREREKEEFSRAAMLYQPMKGDIAARFTRGRNIDDDVSAEVWPLHFFRCFFFIFLALKDFSSFTRKLSSVSN